MLLKVMSDLVGGHEDGVGELLVLWVPLLGRCEDLAEVIDWPLHAVGLALLFTLDDEHGADDVALCCDVEVEGLLFAGHDKNWGS